MCVWWCCSCTSTQTLTSTYVISHAIYSLVSLQNCLHIFHNILDGKNDPARPIKVKSGYDHTIGTFGSRRGELHGPRGLCIDSDGRIIVADTGNNRVQAFRFVPRGQAGMVFHREAFSAPWQEKYHGYVCGETLGQYLNLTVISSIYMSPFLRTLTFYIIPPHPRPYHQVRASEKLRGGCQNSPWICIARRPVGGRLDLSGQHRICRPCRGEKATVAGGRVGERRWGLVGSESRQEEKPERYYISDGLVEHEVRPVTPLSVPVAGRWEGQEGAEEEGGSEKREKLQSGRRWRRRFIQFGTGRRCISPR